MTSPPLILASSSPFRRQLMARMAVRFEVLVPDTDESPRPGEAAEALVTRLAEAKAMTISRRRPDAIVIGSDQVAVLDGSIFGKPGTHARAVQQLSAASGRRVRFLTAICVLGPESRPAGAETVTTDVHFRQLDTEEIERYLAKEPALNSAGSFQCEGLGISLCERIESTDPTAIIGLPLIATRRLLALAGLALP